MNKKIRIAHHVICLDCDIDKMFMIITEHDGEKILFSYSVKMPENKNYPQLYPYYSEIEN